MVANSVWCLSVHWKKTFFFCKFQVFYVCFQNNGINFECACCITRKMQQHFFFLVTWSNTIWCESYSPKWDILTCKDTIFCELFNLLHVVDTTKSSVLTLFRVDLFGTAQRWWGRGGGEKKRPSLKSATHIL